MGYRVLKPMPLNPKGFFHDIEFEFAWIDGSGDALISLRRSLGVTWGVNTRRSDKAELFAKTGPTKIISTLRAADAVKTSCRRKFRDDSHVDREISATKEAIKKCNVPYLEIDFDSIIDAPLDTVTKIAQFVSKDVTAAAVSFVDPSLRTV